MGIPILLHSLLIVEGICLMRSCITALTNGCEIDQIEASSNLELGMKRAVSIVEFLKPKLITQNSNIKPNSPL